VRDGLPVWWTKDHYRHVIKQAGLRVRRYRTQTLVGLLFRADEDDAVGVGLGDVFASSNWIARAARFADEPEEYLNLATNEVVLRAQQYLRRRAEQLPKAEEGVLRWLLGLATPTDGLGSELCRQVRGAVDSLPDHLREVVRRWYWMGQAATTIAEDLGIGSSTVYKRLRQGEAEVKARLEAGGVEPLVRLLGRSRPAQPARAVRPPLKRAA
jgi:DNA-directed RNA polymerase specialized sigma24 family protein